MLINDLTMEAEREGLLSCLGQSLAPVSFAINLGDDGAYLGLNRLGEEGKPVKMFITKRLVRTGNTLPHLLADKAEYVLGFGEDPKRSEKRFTAFCDLIKVASDSIPSLLPALSFLSDATLVSQCLRDYEQQCQLKDTGNLVFTVKEKFLHDSPEVQDFWFAFSQDTLKRSQPCQSCGKECFPVRLHPKIKGGFEVPLVSFKSSTTESYGLSGSENAPICPRCTVGYTAALQRLLDDYLHPATGEVLKKRVLALDSVTKAVWWQDSGDFVDLVEVWEKGQESSLPPIDGTSSSSSFYCLVLSKYNSGRLTITDYRVSPVLGTGRVVGLLDSLQSYFEDLQLGDNSFETTDPYMITTFEKALWPKEKKRIGKKSKSENVGFRSAMFFSATQGAKFPYWLAPHLLNRISTNISSERRDKRKSVRVLVSLLKAVLRRNYGYGKGHPMEARAILDENNNNNGYLFGRYLAVVEKMHLRAIKPNLTLANSFYKMAAVHPRYVARILQEKKELSVKKIPELRGLANKAEELISRMGEIPKKFNQEDQSWFTLGYNQQKVTLWKKREKPEDNSALLEEAEEPILI